MDYLHSCSVRTVPARTDHAADSDRPVVSIRDRVRPLVVEQRLLHRRAQGTAPAPRRQLGHRVAAAVDQRPVHRHRTEGVHQDNWPRPCRQRRPSSRFNSVALPDPRNPDSTCTGTVPNRKGRRGGSGGMSQPKAGLPLTPPLVFYQGTEPCPNGRTARLAATSDDGLRAAHADFGRSSASKQPFNTTANERPAAIALRVSDLWFTFRAQAVQSITDVVADLSRTAS